MTPAPRTRRPGPPAVTSRQRILAQWRRIDLADEEIARTSTERSLAALLPGLLKTLRVEARRSETAILDQWPRLVPAAIAAHAHPTSIRDGIITITVDNSAWHYEIRAHAGRILATLQKTFGPETVKRLLFRVG